MSHPASCKDEGCQLSYIEHLRGIRIGADALPTRRPDESYQWKRMRQWDRDMDAYKRLRKEGLRPHKIDGCALAESHATERTQIE